MCRLRRQKRWGPARIGARLGVPSSTVHKILVRNGLNRLSHIDRPTGRVIRRYERPEPGDLVHLDVKKVGKVPPGGGWRAHGRANTAARGTKRRPRVGYSYLHVAIDDHSRLAYVEALDNETADTLVGFFDRARVWFRSIGVAVDEVITDNGPNFRSKKFAAQLARRAIAHTFCRPYRPQTNGKAERFNRTLADEFLYSYKFKSEPDRRRRPQTWVHHYNLHRHHTAIGGTPSSRVHNLYGFYTRTRLGLLEHRQIGEHHRRHLRPANPRRTQHRPLGRRSLAAASMRGMHPPCHQYRPQSRMAMDHPKLRNLPMTSP